MLKTSKYTNIKKMLAEVDDLLQQIGPEIIEQSPSLKKLKLERERLAAAATEPDKKADLLIPEGQQLAETREVILAPGRDLSPAVKVADQASVARARRGTLVRWGLMALLAVMALLTGYQWRRAVVAQLAQKEAERSAQSAEKARNLARRDLAVLYESLGNVSLQFGDPRAGRKQLKQRPISPRPGKPPACCQTSVSFGAGRAT